jgi:alkanesulfonate monooxygenase
MSLKPVEISWFSALCDDDYEFLGVSEPALQSSWEHCRNIVLAAEEAGYDNILLPNGYGLGIDTASFAAAIATQVRRIKLLMAVRVGELWPPQLARQIATINQILGGRLNVNIISSDMPGEVLDGPSRYERTLEVITLLRQLMGGHAVDHQGRFYNLRLEPARILQGTQCPPLYFGGLSEPAREVAAKACDVYLQWPDRLDNVKAVVDDMNARAAKYGRKLKQGYRVHVVVRETEAEARAAADRLLSKLDAATGAAIKAKSLDTQSVGVQAQVALREAASDDGYVEDNLWTGIGRARSGCGAAIVGNPDQVLAKLNAYRAAGIDAFVLSGYPHAREADLFARYVLPRIDHAPF